MIQMSILFEKQICLIIYVRYRICAYQSIILGSRFISLQISKIYRGK